MNIHFWILVSDNWGIERQHSRTKVDSSRQKAWAFTRLGMLGYPQYLRDVDESKLSTFSFCAFSNNNSINLNN